MQQVVEGSRGFSVTWLEDGTVMYYYNGVLHQDDNLPAVIYADGTLMYYIHGKPGRTDGGPVVLTADGSMIFETN